MKKKSDSLKFIATCLACGLLFRTARRDRRFCDDRCYNRNRRSARPRPKLGSREEPLTAAAIDLREIILRAAGYHAVYYTVTSADLQVAFPLASDFVRSSGLRPTLPFYRLEPFEFPMVPLVGIYTVHFFTDLGISVGPDGRSAPPQLLITFTYALRRTAPADIRAGVRQLLKDQTPPRPLPSRSSKRALPSKRPGATPPKLVAHTGASDEED